MYNFSLVFPYKEAIESFAAALYTCTISTISSSKSKYVCTQLYSCWYMRSCVIAWLIARYESTICSSSIVIHFVGPSLYCTFINTVLSSVSFLISLSLITFLIAHLCSKGSGFINPFHLSSAAWYAVNLEIFLLLSLNCCTEFIPAFKVGMLGKSSLGCATTWGGRSNTPIAIEAASFMS